MKTRRETSGGSHLARSHFLDLSSSNDDSSSSATRFERQLGEMNLLLVAIDDYKGKDQEFIDLGDDSEDEALPYRVLQSHNHESSHSGV